MSDYTNTFGGAAHDAAEDTILGADHDTQYDSVATMSATKANKKVPAATNNVATLSATGDLGDGGVVVAALGTLTGRETLTNKTLTSPVINTGVSGSAVDTDGTLAANSDTLIASQKATKAYVDETPRWRFVETMNLTGTTDETVTGINSTATAVKVIVDTMNPGTNNGLFWHVKGSTYTDSYWFQADEDWWGTWRFDKIDESTNTWLFTGWALSSGTSGNLYSEFSLDGTIGHMKWSCAGGALTGRIDIWEYY